MLKPITALRKKMQDAGIHACLIPSTDPHQSEYVADHWQIRAWLSGFTGSAGELLVTTEKAALWTDSRYFLQAQQQLAGSGIQLMKQGLPETPDIISWLQSQCPRGSTLGINGWQFSHQRSKKLQNRLAKANIHLHTGFDPYDEIWPERPPLPQDPVFDFPSQFAGETREEKLQRLRKKMGQEKTAFIFLSALDEIAWLFNLRGRDVHCNPVFYAYALIGLQEATLFLPSGKCPHELQNDLAKAGINIKDYHAVKEILRETPPRSTNIWLPENQTNEALYPLLSSGEKQKTNKNSPLALMKAIKNETEIELTRQIMVRDGLALFHFYQWLDKTLKTRAVSEAEAAEKLNEFRREQGSFFGPSFDAIVGFRQNGAIVHYKPEHGSCAMIEGNGMLLIDSGGQYMEGTTDITRTTYLGEPGEDEKKHFTLVLKGHIALARALFPKGTNGCQLDTLARHALWQEKLNYGHGTGHGVGFFLNVHEGPQRIAPFRCTTPLKAGMITSNEPGFYLEGKYGIRIENLILCKEAGDGFLKFETLTLFPIQRQLINHALLSPEERQWLNQYHQNVYEQLAPFLCDEDKNLLREQTKTI